MIGLILGTSEGKKILSLLNDFTDEIFVSCATEYGAELLKDYSFAIINQRPLCYDELVTRLKKDNIRLLIDSTHPYAVEITENAMAACQELSIPYLRFERGSSRDKYSNYSNLIEVEDYSKLSEKLSGIKGTILNTTGSRSLEKILDMKLENRIVHRVLPTEKAIKECIALNIKIEDIIAMKGPFGLELNKGFIKQLNAEAMILKDSGEAGATEEKIKACRETGIKALVISRKNLQYDRVFNKETDLVDYVKKTYFTEL